MSIKTSHSWLWLLCLLSDVSFAQFSAQHNCVWEGQGTQNASPAWSIKLTIRGAFYSIEYPSLSCGGTWKLISETATSGVFSERITYGKQHCEDQGIIELYRKDQNTLRYFYFLSNGDIIAHADLTCSRAESN